MKPVEPQSIISVKEARKLLGKEYAGLSDQEVEVVINDVELMAEIAIKRVKQELRVPNSP